MVERLKRKGSYENSVSVLIAASITFMVALVFAHNPPTEGSVEAEIIKAVYNWPLSLKPYFYAITQLASGWAIMFVAILLWFKRHRILAYTVVMSSVFTFAVTEIVKVLVQRPRPPQVFSTIISRDGMAYGFGFPSGHAAISTLLCLLLWGLVPSSYRWVLILGVILVCISRIYLGVHSPLDIVGGICIGLVIGILLRLPMLKLKHGLHNRPVKHKLDMEV